MLGFSLPLVLFKNLDLLGLDSLVHMVLVLAKALLLHGFVHEETTDQEVIIKVEVRPSVDISQDFKLAGQSAKETLNPNSVLPHNFIELMVSIRMRYLDWMDSTDIRGMMRRSDVTKITKDGPMPRTSI